MTLLLLINVVILLVLLAGVWLLRTRLAEPDRLRGELAALLEDKHRAVLADLHSGLARQADRLATLLTDTSDRQRTALSSELGQARSQLQTLELAQAQGLASTRAALVHSISEVQTTVQGKLDSLRTEMIGKTLQTLGEQGRANQELVQSTMRSATQLLAAAIEGLTRTTDQRLEQISGKVAERLDEGFKKTNDTFISVMARLATIDEAQRKIDGLTTNMVSLQELLGDKRSRGAFGEVQLEALVRNMLPVQTYAFQYTFPNKVRADCVLFLPAPTGTIAIDSKFPLENWHRMFAPDGSDSDRTLAGRLFKTDVRRHIDAIATKYIIPGETCDGAVMFIPAEAVFAEIHSYHGDLGSYAQQKRVWIVSPTTMMAVITTACAVLKDIETRKQVHIIQDALTRLGSEFVRFDDRMKKLATHIRQAHEDAEEVHTTSKKISGQFRIIERVEMEKSAQVALELAPAQDES